MELKITTQKRAKIAPDMMGLFFEDINYAADGGLYAEMIENRSFEFLDCYGDKGDYYTVYDGGYGWKRYPADVKATMQYVTGSPVAEENPHYLRFETKEADVGFSNQAYSGISIEKGQQYAVSFYARSVLFEGNVEVSVRAQDKVYAKAAVSLEKGELRGARFWKKYELMLTAEETVGQALFVMKLDAPGTVEFDFISMMPKDAVCGLFRRDLFELLKGLKPGFIRFPGGCIIEGNTLGNRYRFKDTLKPAEHRKGNWNRWAVHMNNEENGFHSSFSHYNQTLGMGYYEYFVLCEALGAKPLPVLNVGLACQYQAYELVEPDTEEFKQYVQDALDLIEFANGDSHSKWGSVRVALGHERPFGLTMLGIGNEQWDTEKSRFFERYKRFEEAIHAMYPDIRLIGSAGPDITSEKYDKAWDYYHKMCKNGENFVYAVDEHYYVKPEWFYEHTDFYDAYPRDVKVFSGEYAAHPTHTEVMEQKNCLGGALAEAAFLTGVERNADVVVLSSYAPLFARTGFTQWAPDMIWFDDRKAYGSPSYYVQKMYSIFNGTVTLDTMGCEKEAKKEQIYYNPVLDENTGKIYCKIVNASEQQAKLTMADETGKPLLVKAVWSLGGMEKEAYNSIECPTKVALRAWSERELPKTEVLYLEKNTVAVVELAR